MQYVETEEISLDLLYETWIVNNDKIKQCYFANNDWISASEHPYSQCVVGEYLFLELSNQASANLRISTRVYKMIKENNSYKWHYIDISNQISKFLTKTSMSIAPQMCRSCPRNSLIYLQEISSPGRIARSVGIYLLDLYSHTSPDCKYRGRHVEINVDSDWSSIRNDGSFFLLQMSHSV